MQTGYSKRKWLNPKDSANSGMLTLTVDFDYGYLTMDLGVWDCSRKIVLDFGFGTEQGRSTVLRKLQILEEAIHDMRWTATHIELDEATS